jgi:hypothetical protein
MAAKVKIKIDLLLTDKCAHNAVRAKAKYVFPTDGFYAVGLIKNKG